MPFDRYKQVLGAVIREHRMAYGSSQQEVADKAGIHRNYYGSVERGERNVALENLIRIAAALELELSELFEEIESQLEKRG